MYNDVIDNKSKYTIYYTYDISLWNVIRVDNYYMVDGEEVNHDSTYKITYIEPYDSMSRLEEKRLNK